MNRISSILASCLFGFGNVQGQSVPSLGGHTPGELWSNVGRGLPCTNVPSDSLGLFVIHRAIPLKICSAGNGVVLWFMRDTLFVVALTIADDTLWYGQDADARQDTVTVQSWWHAEGHTRGTEWFGEPDSVVFKPFDMGNAGYNDRITAYWQSNTSPKWAAWFFVHKERFTGWSTFSASVMFCSELTTNISCDFKNPFPVIADSAKAKPRVRRRSPP